MAASERTAPEHLTRFLVVHALLIPVAFAAAAVAVRSTGIDAHLSAYFFDPATNAFPARASIALELVGHRLARSAVVALWLTLLAFALAAPLMEEVQAVRAVLWTTLAAMVLGPALVTLLKNINSIQCPWNLKQFGGYAEIGGRWFVAASGAGHCFPSGHAAGGFSLIALRFAGIAAGNARLRALGLAAALIAGTAFSAVRIVQGAHFLSHNLWSAAIDWCAAALAFTPLLASRHAASMAHAADR